MVLILVLCFLQIHNVWKNVSVFCVLSLCLLIVSRFPLLLWISCYWFVVSGGGVIAAIWIWFYCHDLDFCSWVCDLLMYFRILQRLWICCYGFILTCCHSDFDSRFGVVFSDLFVSFENLFGCSFLMRLQIFFGVSNLVSCFRGL